MTVDGVNVMITTEPSDRRTDGQFKDDHLKQGRKADGRGKENAKN